MCKLFNFTTLNSIKIHQNTKKNHLKPSEIPSKQNEPPTNARFDKYLEEFYSICDQIELHLVTAKKCIQQANASQVYLPVPVVPRNENMPQENALTYSQYLELVKTQITYAKEIHDTLLMAAQNI
jgi:mediator of RNA polymerase II transcription subunit 29